MQLARRRDVVASFQNAIPELDEKSHVCLQFATAESDADRPNDEACARWLQCEDDVPKALPLLFVLDAARNPEVVGRRKVDEVAAG